MKGLLISCANGGSAGLLIALVQFGYIPAFAAIAIQSLISYVLGLRS